MQFKASYILMLLMTLGTLFSCTKTDDDNPDPGPEPQPFTIKVRWRNISKAMLAWEEPKTSSAQKPTYSIILDGKKIDSNYTEKFYRLDKLTAPRNYTGRVLATWPNGDTTSRPFTLPIYEAYFYQMAGNDLYCKDFANRTRWIFKAPENINSIPVMNGDTLYLFTTSKIYAVNARVGNTLWSAQAIPHTELTPIFSANSLLTVTERKGAASFDLTSKNLRWKVEGNSTERDVFCIPTAYKDLYYFKEPNGPLTAYNATNGSIKWIYEMGRNLSAITPAVSDDVLVLTYEDKVTAFNALNGSIRWTSTLYSKLYTNVTISNKVAYVVGAGIARAYDLLTGKVLWERGGLGFTILSAAVDDRNLYFRSSQEEYSSVWEHIMAYDIKTGEKVWQTQLPARQSFNHDPIVVDGILYHVNNRLDGIYQIDSYTGEVIDEVKGQLFFRGLFSLWVNGKGYYGAFDGNQQ